MLVTGSLGTCTDLEEGLETLDTITLSSAFAHQQVAAKCGGMAMLCGKHVPKYPLTALKNCLGITQLQYFIPRRKSYGYSGKMTLLTPYTCSSGCVIFSRE